MPKAITVRPLTIADLPDPCPPGVMLHCAKCQEDYSATRGDYFWRTPTQAFRCQRCRTLLRLMVRVTEYRPFVAGVFLLACLLGSACSSPIGPSMNTPAVASVTLTIVTLERTTEHVLRDVDVYHDDVYRGRTDQNGQLLIATALSQETSIRVSTPAHGPMIATATPNSSERWTFYLEKLQ